MPECSTHEITSEVPFTGQLISPLPDTDFRAYLEEVDKLIQFTPKIIDEINKDLETYGLIKKRWRLEDREFHESQTTELTGFDLPERDLTLDRITLGVGRPRMSGYVVFVFMLRGYLGSLTSKPVRRFILESISLHEFLQRHSLEMPGFTTMLENVNAVSSATHDLIMDWQIKLVIKEDLDDFKALTIDSTAVKANSGWPTDGKYFCTPWRSSAVI